MLMPISSIGAVFAAKKAGGPREMAVLRAGGDNAAEGDVLAD